MGIDGGGSSADQGEGARPSGQGRRRWARTAELRRRTATWRTVRSSTGAGEIRERGEREREGELREGEKELGPFLFIERGGEGVMASVASNSINGVFNGGEKELGPFLD
jgi:hypothetical protein